MTYSLGVLPRTTRFLGAASSFKPLSAVGSTASTGSATGFSSPTPLETFSTSLETLSSLGTLLSDPDSLISSAAWTSSSWFSTFLGTEILFERDPRLQTPQQTAINETRKIEEDMAAIRVFSRKKFLIRPSNPEYDSFVDASALALVASTAFSSSFLK